MISDVSTNFVTFILGVSTQFGRLYVSDTFNRELLIPRLQRLYENANLGRSGGSILSLQVLKKDDRGLDGPQPKSGLETEESFPTEQVWGGGWRLCASPYLIQGLFEEHAQKKFLGRRCCAVFPCQSI